MQYDPKNWYWQAADGRLFSSAVGAQIKTTDKAFKAWLAGGNMPTPWPRDLDGNQTDAVLQEVLAPYGLYVGGSDSLAAYAAHKRWEVETGGIVIDGMPIPTDRESQSMISSAFQVASVTGQTIKFKTADGFVELLPEQMQGIALTVAAHVQASFAAEAEVNEKIEAGEIASIEQIDAYAWPGAAP